jgi:hypothetical protein
MNEEQRKLIEQAQRQRERIKRQNEAAKNNWDCVSLKLPKGTKQQIIDKGETVNGLINRLVKEYLENN